MDRARKIPKIASASLVLGAMGCGGGSKSPPGTSIGQAGCAIFQKCDPVGFQTYYAGSISKCTTTFTSFIAKYSSTCQHALLAYYDCQVKHLQAASDECSMAARDATVMACAGYYNTALGVCPAR